MRASLLCILLLTACGQPPPETEVAAPLDGFLGFLPENLSVTLRLPCDGTPGCKALLAAMGREGALFSAEGVDAQRSQGLAITTEGDWVHYLPASDKLALSRALGERAHKLAYREERDWVILSRGGKGAGKVQGDPLPLGALALRVRFHPLLNMAFAPGDTLELGMTLAGGGIDMSGRLIPAVKGATAARLAQATPLESSLIEYIPGSLALRVETTLPATALAGLLTRRLARHCGVADQEQRVLLERFLRELMTAVDPRKGFAWGIEFHQGTASVVALGRIAGGPPSPLLAGIRNRGRTTLGPLVLDLRREAPRSILGYYAWVVEAQPKLEGLAETAWSSVGELCGGGQGGLPIAMGSHEDWFLFGAGQRADLLLRNVRRRLREGPRRSRGSLALRHVKERAEGGYVLGVVFSGPNLAEMAENDRRALREALGAGEGAAAPAVVAVAGFQKGAELALEGRALY